MGFRVSWIARRGESAAELLGVSGRALTGERHEFPDVGWYLLELPGKGERGWVLLIADGTEHFLELGAADAEALSVGGQETVFFTCSDTVMATELRCFRDGREAWSVQYDCGDKTKQPAMSGAVPPIAIEILRTLRETQSADGGADYIYDLTAELGRQVVGFRHDTDVESDDPAPFQLLGEPTKAPAAWWQFWKR
ncbi:MAG: hypothetical protein E6Q76_04515 [Rhizobium sp.]|nr:MAG: hypothetical protein E6Q76_04515 [Rhizobium sp.]